MNFRNELKAERILENISYNRLSNYWYPFLAEPKEDELFKPGVEFGTIFKIYQFDSELRSLVFNAIEQIEVALRTQLIYHLSHQYNGGYGFMEFEAYTSLETYLRSMVKVQEAVKASKQPFIVKFKSNYTNQLPPAWKCFELLTFRSLYSLYKNLKDTSNKRAIGDHFGLNHTVFVSWIDTLVYVRNICAHHSRL
ncbi:Abi family protein [Neolewinella antarctica]|uniref:Abortive infection bacteriophage resistance protein n=1 Tax=Neolewinella antarctica TaxID=442734 RepID=A0ABX0XCZ8_9BACT|nr:Abi family protein [Neolewinella antarctica]NJC27160.1 abortive infection bacteriophage resistance protein [Neolewinella antarctica]